MEAANQGEQGELCVAFVLVNRLKRGRYGTTLADVCLAPNQFSCWNTSEPTRRLLARASEEDTALVRAQEALAQARSGSVSDPTQGAVLYYADYMTRPPAWAARSKFTVKVGRHLFFTDG